VAQGSECDEISISNDINCCIAVPTAAFAKGECQDNVQKFCRDVAGEKGAVVACLQQHMAELSEACKTRLSQQPS